MPDGQVVMRAGFTARKPALPSAGVRTHQQTAKRNASGKHEIPKTNHPMGDPFYGMNKVVASMSQTMSHN
jgi:hypothetical protein